MSLRDFVRYRARDAHHWVWNQRLHHFGDTTISQRVNGSTADFLVGSWKEHWRATSLMNEGDILERTLQHVKPTDTVWDIGANVGTYSIHFAQHSEHVIAFEPTPGNYQRLLENAERNNVLGSVEVCPVALSDHDDLVPFWIKPEQRGEGTHKVHEENATVQMPAFRGDSLNLTPPDVIKIDVEGHEVQVLDGLSHRLGGARYVIIEVHDPEDVEYVETTLRLAGLESRLVERETSRSETYVEGVR